MSSSLALELEILARLCAFCGAVRAAANCGVGW